MKSGKPAGQGGQFQGVGNTDSSGSTASHATAELARVLNYQPGERVSLNWQQRPGGKFTSRIVDAADLPAAIEQAPEQSCTWIGVNPTSATSGRGRADAVTRLAAIVYELDYDDDKGCTREQGAAVADELDRLIWPATAVVESGHGQHFYIPTAGGTISDTFTRADATTLLARFRRLLVAVARKHGAADPDNVTELARVMRAPGTTNWKDPDRPVPVTISIRAGATTPTVDMIRGYLDAAEVEYPPEPPAPPERATSSTVAPAAGGSDRLRRYALNVLEREAAELAGMAPETGRNNKLNDAALRCYRLADGAGMDRVIVTATLRDAAERAGTPGIEATLRSAASKSDEAGPAYPPDDGRGWDLDNTDFDPGPGGGDGGGDSRDLFEIAVTHDLNKLQVRAEAQRRFDATQRPALTYPPVTGLAALLDEPDEPTRYTVDRLAPAGGRTLAAAQYKAGKTTIRDNLVRSLADGEPFLGEFNTTPGHRIGLIDNELSRNTARLWLRDQRIRNTSAVADVVTLRGNVAAFNLLDDAVRAYWAGRFRDLGITYLVLDCLRPVLDALGLDEHRDAGRFLVAFDALLAEAGITDALVVHHMGHNGERARGDSRLLDWPDAIWRVVRDRDDNPDDPAAPRYFSAYGRDVDVPEARLDYEPEGRRLTYSPGDDRRSAKTTEAKQAAIEIVAAHTGDGLSQNQIREAMRDRYGISFARAREGINAAVAAGGIVREDGPNRTQLHCLNPSWRR